MRHLATSTLPPNLKEAANGHLDIRLAICASPKLSTFFDVDKSCKASVCLNWWGSDGGDEFEVDVTDSAVVNNVWRCNLGCFRYSIRTGRSLLLAYLADVPYLTVTVKLHPSPLQMTSLAFSGKISDFSTIVFNRSESANDFIDIPHDPTHPLTSFQLPEERLYMTETIAAGHTEQYHLVLKSDVSLVHVKDVPLTAKHLTSKSFDVKMDGVYSLNIDRQVKKQLKPRTTEASGVGRTQIMQGLLPMWNISDSRLLFLATVTHFDVAVDHIELSDSALIQFLTTARSSSRLHMGRASSKPISISSFFVCYNLPSTRDEVRHCTRSLSRDLKRIDFGCHESHPMCLDSTQMDAWWTTVLKLRVVVKFKLDPKPVCIGEARIALKHLLGDEALSDGSLRNLPVYASPAIRYQCRSVKDGKTSTNVGDIVANLSVAFGFRSIQSMPAAELGTKVSSKVKHLRSHSVDCEGKRLTRMQTGISNQPARGVNVNCPVAKQFDKLQLTLVVSQLELAPGDSFLISGSKILLSCLFLNGQRCTSFATERCTAGRDPVQFDSKMVVTSQFDPVDLMKRCKNNQVAVEVWLRHPGGTEERTIDDSDELVGIAMVPLQDLAGQLGQSTLKVDRAPFNAVDDWFALTDLTTGSSRGRVKTLVQVDVCRLSHVVEPTTSVVSATPKVTRQKRLPPPPQPPPSTARSTVASSGYAEPTSLGSSASSVDKSSTFLDLTLNIISGRDLPLIARSRGRNDRHSSSEKEAVMEPSTYVTVQSTGERSKLVTSELRPSTSTPDWNFNCPIRLDLDAVFGNDLSPHRQPFQTFQSVAEVGITLQSRHLVVKLWHCFDSSKQTAKVRGDAYVIGFAAIDLLPLVSGSVKSVIDWFDVFDLKMRRRGQISLRISPACPPDESTSPVGDLVKVCDVSSGVNTGPKMAVVTCPCSLESGLCAKHSRGKSADQLTSLQPTLPTVSKANEVSVSQLKVRLDERLADMQRCLDRLTVSAKNDQTTADNNTPADRQPSSFRPSSECLRTAFGGPLTDFGIGTTRSGSSSTASSLSKTSMATYVADSGPLPIPNLHPLSSEDLVTLGISSCSRPGSATERSLSRLEQLIDIDDLMRFNDARQGK